MTDREKAKIALERIGEDAGRECWQVVFFYPGGLAVGSNYISKGTALMWQKIIGDHIEAGERTIPCVSLGNGEPERLHVGPLLKISIHRATELVTFASFTAPLGLADDCAEFQDEIVARFAEANRVAAMAGRVLNFDACQVGNA